MPRSLTWYIIYLKQFMWGTIHLIQKFGFLLLAHIQELISMCLSSDAYSNKSVSLPLLYMIDTCICKIYLIPVVLNIVRPGSSDDPDIISRLQRFPVLHWASSAALRGLLHFKRVIALLTMVSSYTVNLAAF